MTFGEKLKELREQKGLSQRQVASILGYDAPMYNRIERGERQMRREILDKVAKLYDVPLDYLISVWIANRVYSLIQYESNASEILSLVAEDIVLYNSPSTKK